MKKLINKVVDFISSRLDVLLIIFIMFVLLGLMHHLIFMGVSNG